MRIYWDVVSLCTSWPYSIILVVQQCSQGRLEIAQKRGMQICKVHPNAAINEGRIVKPLAVSMTCKTWMAMPRKQPRLEQRKT